MSLKWLISWVMTFSLFKLLTGVEIRGKIHKSSPLLIASNHLSFLDPPLIGYTAFREVYFLAKPGLFAISRFFTWLITSYNAISLGTDGIKQAIRLLKEGKVVVIFPEGTRSRQGHLLPFNIGIGYLSINYNVPVVPVRIINSNKNFFSLMLRINKLKIIYGKPISPSGYEKNRTGYEKFTEIIRNAVEQLK
ncbi:MAG: lysophospholipid acyltransferase family protein [candidate division WOR-3 bacterium]